MDLRWRRPLQPQKSKRCSLSDTFLLSPVGAMCEGVAAAMWLEGDYVNDLHYFSIEAMFAGRVCALRVCCFGLPAFMCQLVG